MIRTDHLMSRGFVACDRACSASSSALLIEAMKHAALLSLVGFLIVAPWRASLGAEGGHDFGKWEKEIAAYEQMDRTNPPPAGALLFIGSSTIRLWKTLAQDFPTHRVINRGFGGSEIVAKIHSKLPETEIAFISLSPSIARWKQADKEKAVNTMIEEYVRKTPRLKYIETYPMPLGTDGRPRPELFVADKLHFNAAGYKLLAEIVRPHLPK